MNALEILKRVFGYDTFRDQQEQIIQSVLDGHDTLVLMPTGGGKSLCYQVPALVKEGLAIVVSPLIALMKDQVDALRIAGVEAAYLNSTQTSSEQREIVRKIESGKLKLLYVAPERINERFWSFLQTLKINLFAIDEAHCISHWGHDFRPDYLNLAGIKAFFPQVPVIALTATADDLTRKDILDRLKLMQPKVFVSSFNRPNITYLIEPKRDTYSRLVDFLNERTEDAGVVYCLSRNATEDIANRLQQDGFSALPYHAGLPREIRSEHQDKFLKDEVKIIVATIAFGMGIDKSNVRFVVHMDLPKNIESYYQETGRAGRDGLPSTAILFYTYADVIKLRSFVEIEDNTEQSEIMLKKLDQMASFCSGKICRRRYLLNYFDEKAPYYCGNCDICLAEYEKEEATIPAQKVLSAVVRLEENFGIGYVVDFLKGSQSGKIWEKHKVLKTYGAGAEWTKEAWVKFIYGMIDQEVLMQGGKDFPVLQLTEKSKKILKGEEQYFLLKKKEKKKVQEDEAVQKHEKALFDKLKKVRTELATKEGVPPYLVLSDATLQEMSRYLPLTLENVGRIHGFGEVKLDRYGFTFLREVKSYAEQHGLNSQMHLKKQVKTSTSTKNSRSSKEDTYQQSLDMLLQGKTIEEVAQERGLSKQTVENHVSYWIKFGKLAIDAFVTQEKQQIIRKTASELGNLQLKPIKEALGEDVSYGEIRWTLVEMEKVI